jgi:hypothetical protein
LKETPEEYANRVLSYCLTATKAVDLHDPQLQPIVEKAAAPALEVDPFDRAVDAIFEEIDGTPRETKPTVKASSEPEKDSFDEEVKKKFLNF